MLTTKWYSRSGFMRYRRLKTPRHCLTPVTEGDALVSAAGWVIAGSDRNEWEKEMDYVKWEVIGGDGRLVDWEDARNRIIIASNSSLNSDLEMKPPVRLSKMVMEILSDCRVTYWGRNEHHPSIDQRWTWKPKMTYDFTLISLKMIRRNVKCWNHLD